VTDEWAVDRLDLPAYLDRVGLDPDGLAAALAARGDQERS
jgi:hypothetical protein